MSSRRLPSEDARGPDPIVGSSDGPTVAAPPDGGGWAARLLPWSAALAGALAASRVFGDALWPCAIACQGGGHYQRLWGVPVWIAAVVLMAGVAVCAAAARRMPAGPRRAGAGLAAGALAAVAAGGALYFLWVSWRLGLVCPYCLAVHAGVLATAALALAAAPPQLPLAGLAFLGLHFAFHPAVIEDGPAPPAAPPADAPAIGAFLAPRPEAPPPAVLDPRIDALRREGSPDSPFVLEAAIDLHCPHCAAAHGPLMAALRERIAAGRVEVVLRFLTRRSAPSGRELAGHALATGDPARTRLLLSLLLGTPEGRGWAAVRSRVAELADPAAIEAAYAADRAAIEGLLDADNARLRELGARSTPFIALSRRGGDTLLRWDERSLDVQALGRSLDPPQRPER